MFFGVRRVSLCWICIFYIFIFLICFTKIEYLSENNEFLFKDNGAKINYLNQSRKPYLVQKKIVAYSLGRFLEIDGKEVFCSKYIPVASRVIKNSKWMKLDGADIYTYSSYYDFRLKPYKYVRVIAMIRGNPNISLYCHLDENEKLYTIHASTNLMWDENWYLDHNKTYTAILIACKVPLSTKLPKTVAISQNPCMSPKFRQKIWNNTKVLKPNKNTSKTITICVKPLNFLEDISDRLIEWLEINKILGANNIDIYLGHLHPKIRKVLKYYEKNKFVKSFLGNRIQNIGNEIENNRKIVDWQKRKYEIAFYNDCFYRNLGSNFIIPIDIDEVIFPKKFANWQQFLFSLNKTILDSYSSFLVRNTYFMTNISNNNESISILKYLTRTNFSRESYYTKSFISTDNTLYLFNHYALKQLKPNVEITYLLPENEVQLNHYKQYCFAPRCYDYDKLWDRNSSRFYDNTALRFKNELKNNVQSVLDSINNEN